MRVLDLFCGAGGAAMGLHHAWPNADITGVDINPQPRYPFKFVQADAMAFPLEGYDFIWASPMCQAHTWAARRWGKKWPNQIGPLREHLAVSGIPFVIENVVGAQLLHPFRLCGLMFGLRVIRHRIFETTFPVLVPPHQKCAGSVASGKAYTVAGHGAQSKSYKYEDWANAMDIHWMTKNELTQAVPPSYSEFIARQFLDTTACRLPHNAPSDLARKVTDSHPSATCPSTGTRRRRRLARKQHPTHDLEWARAGTGE